MNCRPALFEDNSSFFSRARAEFYLDRGIQDCTSTAGLVGVLCRRGISDRQSKKTTTLPLPIEVEEKQALPPFRRFLPIFIPPSPPLLPSPTHPRQQERRGGEHSFHIRASFPFSILALPRIEIAHWRKLFLGVHLICLSTKEQKI